MKTTVSLFLMALLMASCNLFYNPASVSSAYGGKEPENCPPDWDKYPSGVFQLIGVNDDLADDDVYTFKAAFGPHDYGSLSIKKTTARRYGLHVGDVVSQDAQETYKKYPIHLTDVEKEREELRSYNVLEPDPARYKFGMTVENTCPQWFYERYTNTPKIVTVRIEGGRLEKLDDAEAFWTWILHVKGLTYENKRFLVNHIEARNKQIHRGDIIYIGFPDERRFTVDSWGKYEIQSIYTLEEYREGIIHNGNGSLRKNKEGQTVEEAYRKFNFRAKDFFPEWDNFGREY